MSNLDFEKALECCDDAGCRPQNESKLNGTLIPGEMPTIVQV